MEVPETQKIIESNENVKKKSGGKAPQQETKKTLTKKKLDF